MTMAITTTATKDVQTTLSNVMISLAIKDVKLDSLLIKKQLLSKEEIKEYNALRKMYRTERKLSQWREERNTITVNGKEYAIKASLCENLKGQTLILFKGLDKNGIAYIKEGKEGLCEVGISLSSKTLDELRKAQLKKTSKLDKDVLEQLTSGLTFSSLLEVVKGKKDTVTCKCPKVLEK